MHRTTTVRLTEEQLERIDMLAEHLRAMNDKAKPSRSGAIGYLIDHALDERGLPSWEAIGIVPAERYDGSQSLDG